MNQNREFCASAFIIDPVTKKILLVNHKKFHKWVQPGGHIEQDETPEEAAIREAWEETGVKVTLLGERFPRESDYIRPLGIQCNRNLKGQIHIDITYPAIPNRDQAFVLSDESTDIGWFSREELEFIDVFEDVKISMDYILKHYFYIEEMV